MYPWCNSSGGHVYQFLEEYVEINLGIDDVILSKEDYDWLPKVVRSKCSVCGHIKEEFVSSNLYTNIWEKKYNLLKSHRKKKDE